MSSAPILLHDHTGPDGWWRQARMAADPALTPGIRHFADYAEGGTVFTARRELPHPEPVLIINLGTPIAITDGRGRRTTFAAGEGFIAGLDEAPAISESSGEQQGIQVALSPLAAGQLLGRPVGELTSEVVALDTLFGAAARDLGARLLAAPDPAARIAAIEHFAAPRLHDAIPAPPEIAWAWRQLQAAPARDIASLVAHTGWSHRRFIDRFRAHIGLSPRRFASIVRFDRLIQRATTPGGAGWAALAVDAGYFDQPHMVRDFTRYAGITPGEWLARLVADGGGLAER